jgi:hypothetical protein
MRRKTVSWLAGIVGILLFGAYGVFWSIAAGRIEEEAASRARAAHEKLVDVSWQTMRVAGFPFSFRLELGGAVIIDKAANPPVELRAPKLTASIVPWNFRTVWFAAPDGLSTLYGPDTAPLAKLDAAAADGALAAGEDGGLTVWATLYRAKAEAGPAISARRATLWFILPAPAAHAGLGVAALLEDVAPPIVPPAFGKTIDSVGAGVTLTNPWPPGSPRQAAAAWRDAGGALQLDHFQLRWGTLGVTAAGSLSLDVDLQPQGTLTGALAGADQLMSALVAAGRIKASDARIAGMALMMLGKPGPDGRTEIPATLTIQNGEMTLGPVRLGKAPRIEW